MLMLLVSWMVLGLLFYLSGLAVLHAVGGSVFIRCADRALLAVWLGMFLFVTLSLGIALFTPLSPAAGAMLAAAPVCRHCFVNASGSICFSLPAR